jgi:hypothetical protein
VHRLLLTLALIPAVMSAQTTGVPDPLDALVKDSPFAPVAGAARSANGGQTGPIEFRSVVFENGEYAFSLYDQGSQQSAWVKIGETGLPFVVRSYDRERDIVTIEHQGQSLVLELQPGRMTDQQPGASGPPMPVPGNSGPGNVPPLPTPGQMNSSQGPQPASPANAVPPPGFTNEMESQRLQALADEIRRRRQSPLRPSPK